MMRALTCAAALAVSAVSTPASADIFKLFAEVHTGTVVGKAVAGDQPNKDKAFFVGAPPFAYGLLVGANILFINAWVQHHEFTNGDRVATWTQFGLGSHFEAGIGNVFLEVGLGLWYGLGTGQQALPPPDGGSVTDKAVMVEGRAGVGYHLNSVLDVGAMVPLSAGLFIKSGPGSSSTDVSKYYGGVEGEALLYLRANLRVL